MAALLTSSVWSPGWSQRASAGPHLLTEPGLWEQTLQRAQSPNKDTISFVWRGKTHNGERRSLIPSEAPGCLSPPKEMSSCTSVNTLWNQPREEKIHMLRSKVHTCIMKLHIDLINVRNHSDIWAFPSLVSLILLRMHEKTWGSLCSISNSREVMMANLEPWHLPPKQSPFWVALWAANHLLDLPVPGGFLQRATHC